MNRIGLGDRIIWNVLLKHNKAFDKSSTGRLSVSPDMNKFLWQRKNICCMMREMKKLGG